MSLLKADGSRKPVPLLKTGLQNDEPHVSPDGRWMAYGSVESGPWDVYVASFPDFQNKRQVSNGGGAQAVWRGDGKELYYLTLDGKMMAIETTRGATLRTGIPKFLFDTRLRRPKPVMYQYGVSPDGQKLLVAEPLQQVAKTHHRGSEFGRQRFSRSPHAENCPTPTFFFPFAVNLPEVESAGVCRQNSLGILDGRNAPWRGDT